MARVQQILLAGRVSGSDEGSMSRNITVLQRSKLRLRGTECSKVTQPRSDRATSLASVSPWPNPILFRPRYCWI